MIFVHLFAYSVNGKVACVHVHACVCACVRTSVCFANVIGGKKRVWHYNVCQPSTQEAEVRDVQ